MSMYVPIGLFFGLCIVLIGLMILAFRVSGIPGIVLSFISFFISFYNSKLVINGQLIENISGLDSSGNVVQGITIIQIPALSYIFTFTGLFMVGLMIYHISNVVQDKKSEYSEIDF